MLHLTFSRQAQVSTTSWFSANIKLLLSLCQPALTTQSGNHQSWHAVSPALCESIKLHGPTLRNWRHSVASIRWNNIGPHHESMMHQHNDKWVWGHMTHGHWPEHWIAKVQAEIQLEVSSSIQAPRTAQPWLAPRHSYLGQSLTWKWRPTLLAVYPGWEVHWHVPSTLVLTLYNKGGTVKQNSFLEAFKGRSRIDRVVSEDKDGID